MAHLQTHRDGLATTASLRLGPGGVPRRCEGVACNTGDGVAENRGGLILLAVVRNEMNQRACTQCRAKPSIPISLATAAGPSRVKNSPALRKTCENNAQSPRTQLGSKQEPGAIRC